MVDVVTNIYRPEILISVHTSKPIDQTAHPIDAKTKQRPPVFWCGVCNIKLANPLTAIQHVHGRGHKVKTERSKSPGGGNPLKRKLNDPSNVGIENGVNGSLHKKSKPEIFETTAQRLESVDSNLKCETCETVFNDVVWTIQHYKGKKHAARMEAVYRQQEMEKFVEDLNCEDCNQEFRSALLAVKHFKGRKHAAKVGAIFVEKMGLEKFIVKERKQAEEVDPCLHCVVCEKEFTSTVNSLQHFQGKKHASKVMSVAKQKKKTEINAGLQLVEGEENGIEAVEGEENGGEAVEGEEMENDLQPVKEECDLQPDE